MDLYNAHSKTHIFGFERCDWFRGGGASHLVSVPHHGSDTIIDI